MKGLNPFEFVAAIKGILQGRIDIPQRLAGNQTLRVLLNRRSVRDFSSRQIEADVLAAILEAGRLAPSTVNLQTWSFCLFDSSSWMKTFGESIPFGASKAVIVLGDAFRMRQVIDEFPFKPLVEYTLAVINASIAAYAMNIAAEACGVSAVMLSETGRTGFYDMKYLKEKLRLPNGVFPLLTLVLGYPKGKKPAMPPKLPLREIASHGTYSVPDRSVLAAWLKQMMAGYRATRVIGSFKGQLRKYLANADSAENDLKEMIFHRQEEFPDRAKKGKGSP
jgi:nitroreductase